MSGKYGSVLPDVLEAYKLPGNLVSCKPIGDGIINDTFCVEYEDGQKSHRYLVQRINHDVFKKPYELMENIFRVTTFLAEKICTDGGDAKRETLTVVKNARGDILYAHDDKKSPASFWRVYDFIENTESLNAVRGADDFYDTAFAFGRFQKQFSDFPANTLHETIPDFHNTPLRYEAFMQSAKNDVCGRAASVNTEINFYASQKNAMEICSRAAQTGKLPIRVTHNDTKLNNILFDKTTGKSVCIIDLDTVMPGLAGFDFGDMIRFGANTAAEDEKDLDKVSLDIKLFEVAVRGFVEGASTGDAKCALTNTEIAMLCDCTKNIILEQGIRFLTDYLNGDVYYKTSHPNHNLERAKNQMKLAEDFDAKRNELDAVVKKFL